MSCSPLACGWLSISKLQEHILPSVDTLIKLWAFCVPTMLKQYTGCCMRTTPNRAWTPSMWKLNESKPAHTTQATADGPMKHQKTQMQALQRTNILHNAWSVNCCIAKYHNYTMSFQKENEDTIRYPPCVLVMREEYAARVCACYCGYPKEQFVQNSSRRAQDED